MGYGVWGLWFDTGADVPDSFQKQFDNNLRGTIRVYS